MEVLLGAVRMDAALSLEPILALLSVLARDLQDDFVPFVPRVIDAFTALVEQGASPPICCALLLQELVPSAAKSHVPSACMLLTRVCRGHEQGRKQWR